MYANHITTEGQSMVEAHITRLEFAELSIPARSALMDLGEHVGYDPGPTRGKNASMVWHLSHADALHVEAAIDEAS